MIIDRVLARLGVLPRTAPARSSQSSPLRGRDSLGERHCACLRSGGSRARSREWRCHSTNHSQSSGRWCSRRDSSRSPSARMQSRQSRLRSLDCYQSHLAVTRPGVTVRGHRGPVTSREGHGIVCPFPLTVQCRGRRWWPGRSRRDHVEAAVASWDRGNSGSRVESAPAVAGSSIPRPTPSLPDFARLFLSLSGSLVQWDAVVGSLFICWCHRCRGVEWSCCSGDIRSPLCLFVCKCPRSGCGFSRWCCLCDRFSRST